MLIEIGFTFSDGSSGQIVYTKDYVKVNLRDYMVATLTRTTVQKIGDKPMAVAIETLIDALKADAVACLTEFAESWKKEPVNGDETK